MKAMKAIFAASMVMSLANAAHAYIEPEQCPAVVTELVKKYVDVVDVYDATGVNLQSSDKYEVVSYENLTPGTYNQQYRAKIKVTLDPNWKYRAADEVTLTLKLSGEADCDNLRVMKLEKLKITKERTN